MPVNIASGGTHTFYEEKRRDLLPVCEDLMPGDLRTPQQPSDQLKRVKCAQLGLGSDRVTPGQPNGWT